MAYLPQAIRGRIPNFPFMACPRYAKCSVNNCPLSSSYPNGYTDPLDSEKKCTLPKSYRVKIAADFHGILPYGGMTKREFAGANAWGALPIDEQTIRKVAAKKALKGRGFQDNVYAKVLTQRKCGVSPETRSKNNRVFKETPISAGGI